MIQGVITYLLVYLLAGIIESVDTISGDGTDTPICVIQKVQVEF